MLETRHRNMAIAAVILTAAWSGAALAQAPKYTRSTKVEVKVKQTDRTKPKEAAPKKVEARPELTADDFIAIEGQVADIRSQQTELLEQLIEDTPDDEPNEKADLLYRLADLHAQKQRYWRFIGMDLYPKIEKAKKGKKGALEKEQKTAFETAKKAMLDAVKVYKKIADNPAYKNYPDMDKTLFYFAYTLSSGKYMKEARIVYQRLIQDYPQSVYIPEAYLAFADYFFQQNSLANAEQFYDKVLQFPKASVYNYAKYMKGWVYLNLDRAQEALEIFFDVSQATKGKKKEETLNRASKKDYVRAYAEVGKAQTALKSFQRVDKGYAFDMEQILGDIYLEQGKAEKAVYFFRELITEKPKDKRVCEWQNNVVHSMITAGDDQHKAEAIETLVKHYVSLRDKKVLPKENLAECREEAEGITSEMAKLWHNEANKTLNFETLGLVDRLYTLFLESFPDSPEYGEIQYYAAELLWARAQGEKNGRLATELWERAANAFTAVVESGKVEGKQLKDSAYATVLAWKNALQVDPRTKQPPIPTEKELEKIPEPQPIPEREAKMLSAFDVYIKYIKDPKDKDLVEMKFLKGRMYWRYNHYEEAIPIFEDIIETHLDHEDSEASINILLDILIRTKKFSQMVALGDKLLANDKYLADRDELKERLEANKAKSMRDAVEQLREEAKKSGDFEQYVACGKGYLEIFNRDPEGAKSDEVLYNAGVCFEEGHSIGAAINMFKQLIERFKDSNSAKRAIARLGFNYGRIAWYDKAAEQFEEYARRFSAEEDSLKAASDAVFYRKGTGEDELAIKDTELFVKKYKDKVKEASAALYSMTAIYEKQGKSDEVVKHLQRYLGQYGNKGGVDRKVIAYQKIGQILWDQSCPVKGVNGACVKITRERSTVQRKKKKRGGVDLPLQCGPESKIKLVVVPRDAKKMKAAKDAFNAAIKAYQGGGEVPGEGDEKATSAALMIRSFAAAKFELANERYESFLTLAFPTKLDFDKTKPKVVEKSTKRFLDYIGQKEKLGLAAEEAYKAIVAITGGGAHYAIASAARAGQVWQNFSDQLYTAEIPQEVRSGEFAEDKVDAFCDELATQATPLEDRSVKAFDACLKTSTDLNWFNEWSQLCERELGQIRPQDYPTASEVRPPSDNVAPVIDLEPAVTVKDLEGTP